MSVQRAADAVRAYQRVAELAPDTPGIAKKIAAAQASAAKLDAGNRAIRDAQGIADSGKRFSNLEPDTQTH